jgi:CTP synthase (UTP-ammonia lyase)
MPLRFIVRPTTKGAAVRRTCGTLSPAMKDGVTRRAQIAVVGDFNPANVTHQLTSSALQHIGLAFTWVPTDAPGDWDERLAAYDGVWIAPASPYRSMDGALAAVRYARERGVPLVGT